MCNGYKIEFIKKDLHTNKEEKIIFQRETEFSSVKAVYTDAFHALDNLASDDISDNLRWACVGSNLLYNFSANKEKFNKYKKIDWVDQNNLLKYTLEILCF